MDTELFPRLDSFAAEGLWHALEDANEAKPAADLHHPAVTYTQTGGHPVSPSRLREIRASLQRIAIECGFPHDRGDDGLRRFDFDTARYLSEGARIPLCEALRQDVWAFFTLVLAPDITDWRFPGRNRQRWVGGIRNTLGVLWRRGFLIGVDQQDGRGEGWHHLRPLTQDAMVQIIERPLLSASPKTARSIAIVWNRTANTNPPGGMEYLTRAAIRHLCALRYTHDLDGLSEKALVTKIEGEFDRTAGKCNEDIVF